MGRVVPGSPPWGPHRALRHLVGQPPWFPDRKAANGPPRAAGGPFIVAGPGGPGAAGRRWPGHEFRAVEVHVMPRPFGHDVLAAGGQARELVLQPHSGKTRRSTRMARRLVARSSASTCLRPISRAARPPPRAASPRRARRAGWRVPVRSRASPAQPGAVLAAAPAAASVSLRNAAAWRYFRAAGQDGGGPFRHRGGGRATLCCARWRPLPVRAPGSARLPGKRGLPRPPAGLPPACSCPGSWQARPWPGRSGSPAGRPGPPGPGSN